MIFAESLFKSLEHRFFFCNCLTLKCTCCVLANVIEKMKVNEGWSVVLIYSIDAYICTYMYVYISELNMKMSKT